jgi:hypothetical protein
MKRFILALTVLLGFSVCAFAGDAQSSPFSRQSKAGGSNGGVTNHIAGTIPIPLDLTWNNNLGPNGAYAKFLSGHNGSQGGFLVWDRTWKQAYIFVPDWYVNDDDFSSSGTWFGPLNPQD